MRGQSCNSFLNYWAANQALSTIFVEIDFSIRNSIKTGTDGNSWTHVAAVNIKQYYLHIHLSDIILEAAIFLFTEKKFS